MEKKRVQLVIKGMHCANCAGTITKKLLKTKGVTRAEVNFATEKAVVEFNGITENAIISSIEQAGYKADLDSKKPPKNEFSLIKLSVKNHILGYMPHSYWGITLNFPIGTVEFCLFRLSLTGISIYYLRTYFVVTL